MMHSDKASVEVSSGHANLAWKPVLFCSFLYNLLLSTVWEQVRQ